MYAVPVSISASWFSRSTFPLMIDDPSICRDDLWTPSDRFSIICWFYRPDDESPAWLHDRLLADLLRHFRIYSRVNQGKGSMLDHFHVVRVSARGFFSTHSLDLLENQVQWDRWLC